MGGIRYICGLVELVEAALLLALAVPVVRPIPVALVCDGIEGAVGEFIINTGVGTYFGWPGTPIVADGGASGTGGLGGLLSS
jgi:hypothetical protein